MRALLLGLVFIVVQIFSDEFCNKSCSSIVHPITQIPTSSLNCTLPNLPKLTINAVDVLDADGDLKHYWARHTVCDVLGWMEKAVAYVEPNYVGIDPQTISNDVELRIGHMKPVICC